MNKKRQFSTEEARSIGTQLKMDWSKVRLEKFRRGLEVELEILIHHGNSFEGR